MSTGDDSLHYFIHVSHKYLPLFVSIFRGSRRISRSQKPSMWATLRTMRAPLWWAVSWTQVSPTQSSLTSSRNRKRFVCVCRCVCGRERMWTFVKWNVLALSLFLSLSRSFRSLRSWLRGNRLRSERSTLDFPVLRKELGRFLSRAFLGYVRLLIHIQNSFLVFIVWGRTYRECVMHYWIKRKQLIWLNITHFYMQVKLGGNL